MPGCALGCTRGFTGGHLVPPGLYQPGYEWLRRDRGAPVGTRVACHLLPLPTAHSPARENAVPGRALGCTRGFTGGHLVPPGLYQPGYEWPRRDRGARLSHGLRVTCSPCPLPTHVPGKMPCRVAPWVVPGAPPGATWSPLGCTSRDTSGSGEIEELRLGHGLRHTWSPLPAARLRLIIGRLTGIASKPCLMERRADQSGGAVTPAVSPGLCLKGLLRAGNALTMGTAGVERRELHRQSWIILCTVHGHARRWYRAVLWRDRAVPGDGRPAHTAVGPVPWEGGRG